MCAASHRWETGLAFKCCGYIIPQMWFYFTSLHNSLFFNDLFYLMDIKNTRNKSLHSIFAPILGAAIQDICHENVLRQTRRGGEEMGGD